MNNLVACAFITTFMVFSSAEFPIPNKLYPERPPVDPRCGTSIFGIALCADGIPLPSFSDSDVIELYQMLGMNMFSNKGERFQHSGLGIHNVNTSTNYTLHFLASFGWFGATDNIIINDKEIVWCSQGASCFQKGIHHNFLRETAEINLVARTTGKFFNSFTEWVTWDNKTGPIFLATNTWRSREGPVWTESWDCGAFVQRAFKALYDLGVRFLPGFTPTYWFGIEYSEKPIHLGNDSTIFGPNGDPVLAKNIITYYKGRSKSSERTDYRFFYFNADYWLLKPSNEKVQSETRAVQVPLPGYI